jgi:hypothetical protein
VALKDFLGRGRPRSDEPNEERVQAARTASQARSWAEAANAWGAVLSGPGGEQLGAEPWREHAKALRLSDAFAEGAATIDQGRSVVGDDLALLVEHARLGLRAYARSDEDERHTWKARLLDARAAIRAAHDRGERSKQSLRTAAEIELMLRRWTSAIELWREVERRYPDLRDEALLRLASAHRGDGDVSAARLAMEGLSDASADSEEARRLRRTLTGDEGVAAANAAFASACVRWKEGSDRRLLEVMPAILLDRGHPPERVDAFGPLLQDLDAFLAVRDGVTSASANEARPGGPGIGTACRTVLVCGFLYSGSGAAFDFLRQHPVFHLPFADKETGFLKKPGHLATIIESDGERIPDPATVAESVLASTFGLGQSGRPLAGWATGPTATDRLVAQLRWLVRQLRSSWAECPDHRARAIGGASDALRSFLDAFVADRTPDGRIALLNNAIVGHDLSRAALLSRAVAVAVLRDPRDQFVSQRLESPYALSCEEFVATMQQRYAEFGALLRDEAVARRVIPLRFEAFVDDPEVRSALMARLDVETDHPEPSEPSFHPDRSRRNIGIHRGHGDGDAVRRVGSALLGPYEELTGSW